VKDKNYNKLQSSMVTQPQRNSEAFANFLLELSRKTYGGRGNYWN
jgi:hypothetical protein